MQKANLPEARDNDTITRMARADGNKLCPEKEWMLYIPNSLGGRSISVGRQAVRQKISRFDNFNSVNSKEIVMACN